MSESGEPRLHRRHVETVQINVEAGDENKIARLETAANDVKGWLDLKIKTGRYSLLLLLQLAQAVVDRALNVHTIYDEIGILEESYIRGGTTKIAHQFMTGPLRGLWCKHYFNASFLARNLLNELRYGKDVDDVLRPHMGQILTEEVLNQLVHRVTIAAFERRSSERRLTGEWIVFQKDGPSNYYLTLASHREGPNRRLGDQAISERVKFARDLDATLEWTSSGAPANLLIRILGSAST